MRILRIPKSTAQSCGLLQVLRFEVHSPLEVPCSHAAHTSAPAENKSAGHCQSGSVASEGDFPDDFTGLWPVGFMTSSEGRGSIAIGGTQQLDGSFYWNGKNWKIDLSHFIPILQNLQVNLEHLAYELDHEYVPSPSFKWTPIKPGINPVQNWTMNTCLLRGNWIRDQTNNAVHNTSLVDLMN